MYTTQFIRIIGGSSYRYSVIEKWCGQDQYTLGNGQVKWMMKAYATCLTEGWTEFNKVMVF